MEGIFCNPSCKLYDVLMNISIEIYSKVADKIFLGFLQDQIEEETVLKFIKLIKLNLSILGN